MRCGDCKFFKFDSSRSGVCYNIKIASDYVEGWEGRNAAPDEPCNDGLTATCDEGRAHLSLGKDFGCIHFEQL